MIDKLKIVNNELLHKIFNNSTLSVHSRNIYVKYKFPISYDKLLLREIEAILNISLRLYSKKMEVNVRHPKNSIIIRFYFDEGEIPNDIEEILTEILTELRNLQIDYDEYLITYPDGWTKIYKNTPEYIREKAINSILE